MEMFPDVRVVSMASFPSVVGGAARGVLMISLHGGIVTDSSAAPSSSCRGGNGRDGAEDRMEFKNG